MLRKRLYTALSILVCCLVSQSTLAQVTFTLTEAAITSKTNQIILSIPSGNLAGFPILGGTLNARAVSPALTVIPGSGTVGTTLPLFVTRMKVRSVGSVNLLTGVAEISLTTTDQAIFAGLLSLGDGAIVLDYGLFMGNAVAWQAGNYRSDIAITYTNAVPRFFQVNVPAYLTVTNPVAATTTMAVTSLANFRTTGISTSQAFTYNTSLPTDISLRVGPSPISFATSFPKVQDPVLIPSALRSSLSGTFGVSPINLSLANQALTVPAGVPVSTTNSSSFTNVLSISPELLRSNFVQAGTYSYPLTYTIAKQSSAWPTTPTSASMATSLTITVPRLLEINVPSAPVTLSFTSSANYQQGVTTAVSSPLILSSTVPYTVSVRAATNFTLGANTIPATVMNVQGTAAQAGVNNVTLSTANQTLINSSAPVIDRAILLQYQIPNTKTSALLNKAAGQYEADVIFSITAP